MPKNIASLDGCCASFGVAVCDRCDGSGVGLDGVTDVSAGAGVGLDIGDPFTPCNPSKIIINVIFFIHFFLLFLFKILPYKIPVIGLSLSARIIMYV